MDASGGNTVVEPATEKMTKGSRYYVLHAKEEIERVKAYYHSRPDVIARKEERERLRAEKEKAKKKAKEEREKKKQERLALAIATSKKPKEELKGLVGGAAGDLDDFLRCSEE